MALNSSRKSPCLGCGHHLAGLDKSGKKCKGCPDRIAYVRSLDSKGFSEADEADRVRMSGVLLSEGPPRRGPKPTLATGPPCKFDGCERPAGEGGYCRICRARMKDRKEKGKDPMAPPGIHYRRPQMTAAEWDDVVRRVIEGGEAQNAVAKDMGLNQSSISRRVWAARQKAEACGTKLEIKKPSAKDRLPGPARPVMTIRASFSVSFGGPGR